MIGATASGQGGGSGGTEQQHPNTLTEEEQHEEEAGDSREEGGFQSTTQPCWDNLYFHKSTAYSFYFGASWGWKGVDFGPGVRALEDQEKHFYRFFCFVFLFFARERRL